MGAQALLALTGLAALALVACDEGRPAPRPASGQAPPAAPSAPRPPPALPAPAAGRPEPAERQGCVVRERRTLTDEGLTAAALAPAAGLRVSARRDGREVAHAETDAAGCFRVMTGGAPDEIVLSAEARWPGAASPWLAVGRDDDPQGREPGATWRWSSRGDAVCGLAPGSFTPESGPWLIPERCGAGAIEVFEQARQAMRCLDGALPAGGPRALPSLAVLWSPGLKRDCGSCFFEADAGVDPRVDRQRFDGLVLLSGRDDTPSHWAPSVVAHEVGHWAMAALSRSPGAQGQHFFQAPSAPDLAYQEGWATAFGQRCQAGAGVVYRFMHQGKLYRVDLATLDSSAGPIELPSAGAGVEQPINEFVVASLLWNFWTKPGESAGDARMLAVLGSERLLGPQDRGYPGLDLLDFLDAARCSGQATEGEVQGLTGAVSFPWDGAALCPGP